MKSAVFECLVWDYMIFGFTYLGLPNVCLLSMNLGADFKSSQTTKQLNNSIWTNRKQVKFCFYLPIGPNKNCLIVLWFDCF